MPNQTRPMWLDDADIKARFLAKLVKGEPDECWPWPGHIGKLGYGRYQVRNPRLTKYFQAHRLSFEYAHDREAGSCLDHLCRNKACCNPKHLEEVTVRENTLRGVGPSAVNADKSECPQGHGLSGDNLYIYSTKAGRTQRFCRECRRGHVSKHRVKLKTEEEAPR